MDNKLKDEINFNESGSSGFITDSTEEEAFENDEKRSHSDHSHSSSHHHHHHHHHTHSSKKRRKKTNNNRKDKLKRFIRHNKKYLIYCLITFVVLLCLTFVGKYLDGKIGVFSGDEPTLSENSEENQNLQRIQIDVPFFAEDVEISGSAVMAFVNAEEGTAVSDIFDQYKTSSNRLDIGRPVEISYEISDLPGGYSVKKAEFLVADNKEMKNPLVFDSDGYNTKIEVYNLKTGAQYYYQINLTFNNSAEASVGGSFKTAKGPRILNVEGVYNMRDIGGWPTADGKEIRQGLLYRGCEIDGAVESKYTITQKGINTMLTVLGIKTDMDLRAESDNSKGTNALGASVKHTYYSAPMYMGVFGEKENKESIRRIFSDLSKKSNYPVYLHCTYGQDRTGTVCFLLEALLGVEKENLMKDFYLSGLHHGDVYGAHEGIADFVKTLEKMPGVTMKEKVEGYLLSIGVTEKEIRNIRNILLQA